MRKDMEIGNKITKFTKIEQEEGGRTKDGRREEEKG